MLFFWTILCLVYVKQQFLTLGHFLKYVTYMCNSMILGLTRC